ncbi:Small ribosomal subunit biogenesis [Gurleya vavrai]
MTFKEVNVLQSLDFPTACYDIKLTPNYLLSIGTYKPILKIHDLNELALKNERNLENEPLVISPLEEDATKIAILRSDKYIEFHAKYGLHHTIKIPLYGRDLLYNKIRAELLVLSEDEIFRVNLEEGRFMKSVLSGGNSFDQSFVHNLILVGNENGFSFYDLRNRNKVKENESKRINAVRFKNNDGMIFCVAGDNFIKEFDIRMENEKYKIDIENAKKIKYNDNFMCAMTDKKLNIYNENNLISQLDGKNLNAFEFEKGLFFVASEDFNIKTYFDSEIGNAPSWCSFIDDLNTDLEDYIAVDNDFVKENNLEEFIEDGSLKFYKNTYF